MERTGRIWGRILNILLIVSLLGFVSSVAHHYMVTFYWIGAIWILAVLKMWRHIK